MRSRRSIAGVALAALLALCAFGCGDDGDDDDGENGGGAAAGNVGGTGGAASGVGGAAIGGSGGSISSGGTGAAATGGSGTNLESRIFTACSNWHQNAQVRGCMGSYSEAYLVDCQAELNQAAQTCAAEVEALLDCATVLAFEDFQCDASDNITFAPGVCEAEQTALEQCQQ
jgi:hypothetical protein